MPCFKGVGGGWFCVLDLVLLVVNNSQFLRSSHSCLIDSSLWCRLFRSLLCVFRGGFAFAWEFFGH